MIPAFTDGGVARRASCALGDKKTGEGEKRPSARHHLAAGAALTVSFWRSAVGAPTRLRSCLPGKNSVPNNG